MTLGNKIIRILNTPLLRGALKKLIFIQYARRGKKIQRVQYHSDFDAWEFRIDGTSFLSSGPGWCYDKEYLLQLFRDLSGNGYVPTNGDVVVDIGAGVGEETIVLSSLVGTTGRVFAIEAHPRTFKALQYLVQENNFSNVELSNIALSDQRGTVLIEDSPNSLANSIIQNSGGNQFSIPAETLDDFVNRKNIQRIDLLKMNVEGAEQLIVKGMQETWKKVKHVAISCHDFRFEQGESEFFKTKKIIVEALKAQGFTVKTQHSKNLMVDDYVYGTNPSFQR
jgi:FkbM family methyltransferase